MRAWLVRDRHAVLAAGLLVGLLLRVLVVASPALGRLDSDQAVLYLMARHVGSGELPAFFWGQHYGGSLLQTVLGLAFVVTGPHLWLLRLATGLLSLLVAVLTWRVGAHLWSEPVGAVAGGLLAVGSPELVFYTTTGEAFYTAGICTSLLALLLAARSPLTWRTACLVGLLAGVALWESPFSLLTLLPAGVLLLPVVRAAPARLLPLVVGVAGGGAPLWLSLLSGHAFVPPQFHNQQSVSARVEGAVTGTWSSVFTRFAPSQVPAWLVDRLAVAGLVLVVGVGLLALVRRRDLRLLALLLPVVLWVPFHVRAYLPTDPPSARYGLPLLPFLAVWVASRLRPRQELLAVTGLVLFTGAGLWQAAGALASPEQVLHNASYARLADDLRRHGRNAVYADYWVAYRLAAETDERITADAPAQPRRDSYATAAAQADRTTVVVFAGGPNDSRVADALSGQAFERVIVDQFAVYYGDERLTVPGLGGTFDVDRP